MVEDNVIPFPINGDEKLFEVTVLSPVSYRVWAVDSETAKRRAAILRPVVTSDEPVCVGFPESITVKEVSG